MLHVGDQESRLIPAQGKLRDNRSQTTSFYGGVDRMAGVLELHAGDAFLPGPRFNASTIDLGSAFSDGGQDGCDAIAMRRIGFHAAVFGNHGFAQVSGMQVTDDTRLAAGARARQVAPAGGTVPIDNGQRR